MKLKEQAKNHGAFPNGSEYLSLDFHDANHLDEYYFSRKHREGIWATNLPMRRSNITAHHPRTNPLKGWGLTSVASFNRPRWAIRIRSNQTRRVGSFPALCLSGKNVGTYPRCLRRALGATNSWLVPNRTASYHPSGRPIIAPFRFLMRLTSKYITGLSG